MSEARHEWRVAWADFTPSADKTAELQADGWEPFAVNGGYVYYKKLILVVARNEESAVEARLRAADRDA